MNLIIESVWPLFLKVSNLKIICIFLFIVFCITTFLMIMYKNQREDLKKYVLPEENVLIQNVLPEIRKDIDDKLQLLSKDLSEKEYMVKESQFQIENAGRLLFKMENRKMKDCDRYKMLMQNLKKDLERTETEIKTIQTEVKGLSKRREDLKNDVIKQQEDYRRMLEDFTTVLEDKTGKPISKIRLDTIF